MPKKFSMKADARRRRASALERLEKQILWYVQQVEESDKYTSTLLRARKEVAILKERL